MGRRSRLNGGPVIEVGGIFYVLKVASPSSILCRSARRGLHQSASRHLSNGIGTPGTNPDLNALQSLNLLHRFGIRHGVAVHSGRDPQLLLIEVFPRHLLVHVFCFLSTLLSQRATRHFYSLSKSFFSTFCII